MRRSTETALSTAIPLLKNQAEEEEKFAKTSMDMELTFKITLRDTMEMALRRHEVP